jgi:thiopeptide-type bacteriocin biosynthesis protein
MFLVRYQDEEGPHLRIRLKVSNATREQLLSALESEDVRTDGCRRGSTLKMDKGYHAEVARYGGAAGLRLSERFFCDSTNLALRLIAGGPGLAVRGNRRILCLFSMLAVAGAVERTASGQRRLLMSYAEGLGSWRMGVVQNWQALLAGLGSAETFWDGQPSFVRNALCDYAERCLLLFTGLRYVSASGGLTCTPSRVIGSHLHMTSNRLGITRWEERLLALLAAEAIESAVVSPHSLFPTLTDDTSKSRE